MDESVTTEAIIMDGRAVGDQRAGAGGSQYAFSLFNDRGRAESLIPGAADYAD